MALDVANDLESHINVSGGCERRDSARKRPFFRARAAAPVPADRPTRRMESRRLTIAIILIFWAVQFVGVSLLFQLVFSNERGEGYLPRAIMSLFGVLVSLGMVAVQDRLRDSSLAFRAAIAVLMAIVCPLLLTAISTSVFAAVRGVPLPGIPNWAILAQDYLFRFWIFGTLSATILAMAYASDIQEREERIRKLQALAHSAQLRALRYQLNPHFLFNALNSIASLMSRKRSGEAELMTENLADFLRTTLAMDPQKIITLDEEIALQELYLSIEKVRFPDRLKVVFDIPTELRSARIPALVTQPLIENSIKYAVARSITPVVLRIHARLDENRLKLTIEDDGGDAETLPAKGARLGLHNVAERLDAHYGADANLKTRAKPDGGFINVLSIPLQHGG